MTGNPRPWPLVLRARLLIWRGELGGPEFPVIQPKESRCSKEPSLSCKQAQLSSSSRMEMKLHILKLHPFGAPFS